MRTREQGNQAPWPVNLPPATGCLRAFSGRLELPGDLHYAFEDLRRRRARVEDGHAYAVLDQLPLQPELAAARVEPLPALVDDGQLGRPFHCVYPLRAPGAGWSGCAFLSPAGCRVTSATPQAMRANPMKDDGPSGSARKRAPQSIPKTGTR